MLSENDIAEITKAARKSLNNYFCHNDEIDPKYLQKAIVEAIVTAIKQYDQLR